MLKTKPKKYQKNFFVSERKEKSIIYYSAFPNYRYIIILNLNVIYKY